MTAAWAWLVLAIFITGFVAAYDILAILGHHATMSAQFRDWLFSPLTGPFVVAIWVGVFAGLTAHWLIRTHR